MLPALRGFKTSRHALKSARKLDLPEPRYLWICILPTVCNERGAL
jgi:hypothetical protein